MATAAKSISPGPVGVEPGQIPLPGAAEMFAAMVSSAGSENGEGGRTESPSAEVTPEESADPAVTIIDASALLPMLDQQRATAPAATLVAEPIVVSVKAQALASAQAQVVARAGGDAPVAKPGKEVPAARVFEPGAAAAPTRAGVDPVQADANVTVPIDETSADPRQPAASTSVAQTIKRAGRAKTDAETPAPSAHKGAGAAVNVETGVSQAVTPSGQTTPAAPSTGQPAVAPTLKGEAAAASGRIEARVAAAVEISQAAAAPVAARATAPEARTFDGGKPTVRDATRTAPGIQSAEAAPHAVNARAPASLPDTTQPVSAAAVEQAAKVAQQPVPTGLTPKRVAPQAPSITIVGLETQAATVYAQSQAAIVYAQAAPVVSAPTSKTAMPRPTTDAQPAPVVVAAASRTATPQPVTARVSLPEVQAITVDAQAAPIAAKAEAKLAPPQSVSAKTVAPEVQVIAVDAQAAPIAAKAEANLAAPQSVSAKTVAPEVQAIAGEAQAAPVAAKSTSQSAASPLPATAATAPEPQVVVAEAQAAPIAARTRASRIAVAPAEIRIEPGAVADAATAPTADTRAAAQPLHAAPALGQPLSAPTGAPLPNVAAALSQQVLDMSGGDAWIDQIARDISQTAGKDGAMRFRLAPETLGELKVEITHSERGAHVRLNVSSEGAQQALAAAEHKLTAEARAQGVRIAETEINFTGGQSRDTSSFAREQGQQAQQQSNQQPRMSRGTSANSFTSSAAAPEGRGRTDRYA